MKVLPLTKKVRLSGGQDRLVQLILHVCKRNEEARFFGRIKLNKIIWKADFDAFAKRGIPLTGEAYQRLPQGPALRCMKPLLREMLERGLLEERKRDFGSGKVEQRPIARVPADLQWFSADDLNYVDNSIAHYWNMTGTETSDDSHGMAWSTRHDRDDMPYETAYLSDKILGAAQIERARKRAVSEGFRSL